MSEQAIDYGVVTSEVTPHLTLITPVNDRINARDEHGYLRMIVEDLGTIGELIQEHGSDHFDAPGDTHALLRPEEDGMQVVVFHPRGQETAGCRFTSNWQINSRVENAGFVSVPQILEDGLPHERLRQQLNFGLEAGRLAMRGGMTPSQAQRALEVSSRLTDLRLHLQWY